MATTYPGTRIQRRQCYSCSRSIETVEELWLDIEANCIVCPDCREDSRTWWDTEEEFLLTVVRVTSEDADMLNEMLEG